MIQLTKALSAWESPVFEEILKDEIEQMDVELLPLQQGLSQCSYASGDNLSVVIISVSDDPKTIRAKTGLFYTGLIPGCSCADDPTPVNEYTEYCVVQFDINKITAETRVTLLPE